MWKLDRVDIDAFEDSPLGVIFRLKVKTLMVANGKIIHGTSRKYRMYKKVTEASADRLQKLLVSDTFSCVTYLYHDGIILEYRLSA